MAKKLLEEATVRRFMKVAGIQSLSENFVGNLEEENLEEMYKEEDEEPEAPEEPNDAEEEMDAGEDEEVEMDLVDDEGDMASSKDEIMKALEVIASAALGEKVDLEMEEDADEEMPEEEPEAEADEEMPEPEEDAGEEMPEDEEVLAEARQELKKRLVEQVSKRVLSRLKEIK